MTQTVIPQLRIADVVRSLRFYRDGLGFVLDWEHRFEDHFTAFMQITHEEQTMFLTEHAGDCQPGGAVYFIVPDVDACFERFLANGIVPVQMPEDTSLDSREMVLIDPDGNRASPVIVVERYYRQLLRSSRPFVAWTQQHCSKQLLIELRQLLQNGCVESFNGKFRDDCLNNHWLA